MTHLRAVVGRLTLASSAGVLAAVLAGFFLSGCAGAPRPPAPVTPLPQARADELRTLISSGSYLLALSKMDAIRREGIHVPDLDSLTAQAADRLAGAFKTAADGKKYDEALRLLDRSGVKRLVIHHHALNRVAIYPPGFVDPVRKHHDRVALRFT